MKIRFEKKRDFGDDDAALFVAAQKCRQFPFDNGMDQALELGRFSWRSKDFFRQLLSVDAAVLQAGYAKSIPDLSFERRVDPQLPAHDLIGIPHLCAEATEEFQNRALAGP
jgi:hypothetical protein